MKYLIKQVVLLSSVAYWNFLNYVPEFYQEYVSFSYIFIRKFYQIMF